MCNEFCQGWAIDDALRLARDVGYDGVEIAPFTLADDARQVPLSERQRLRRLAEACGLKLIGLHWLLVKPEGLFITHPEAQIRQQTQDYLEALVHLCADLGGDRLVLGSPKQRLVMPGSTREQAWQRARDVFHGLLPSAAARGVTLCMEPLARTETNFINTVWGSGWSPRSVIPALRCTLTSRRCATKVVLWTSSSGRRPGGPSARERRQSQRSRLGRHGLPADCPSSRRDRV